jgi:hypothetical protein
MHNPSAVRLYIKALEQKHIGGEGFVHVGLQEGFVFIYDLKLDDVEPLLKTGMLFIVEDSVKSARSL